MKIHKLITGPVQANCYILECVGQALIVDPGADGDRIVKKVDQLGVKPLGILLTHGHFDHIGAIDQVRDHFKVPVYIHELEKDFLTDPELNLSVITRRPFSQKPADKFFTKEETMTIGPFTFDICHTPGHSPGSVCFIFKENKQAIVGDTLFNGSIGRTDFPNSDGPTLQASIKNKLMTLDDDVTIYPGHGQATRIQDERESNPFLTFSL